MSQSKLIDDIVAQLDESFQNGTGHVNVMIQNQDVIFEKKSLQEAFVNKEIMSGCTDCTGNTACASPTLQEGMDQE